MHKFGLCDRCVFAYNVRWWLMNQRDHRLMKAKPINVFPFNSALKLPATKSNRIYALCVLLTFHSMWNTLKEWIVKHRRVCVCVCRWGETKMERHSDQTGNQRVFVCSYVVDISFSIAPCRAVCSRAARPYFRRKFIRQKFSIQFQCYTQSINVLKFWFLNLVVFRFLHAVDASSSLVSSIRSSSVCVLRLDSSYFIKPFIRQISYCFPSLLLLRCSIPLVPFGTLRRSFRLPHHIASRILSDGACGRVKPLFRIRSVL